jgi:hypothetical protein
MRTEARRYRAVWRGLALAGLAAAFPIVLGTTGCPETPVTEKVELRFLPEGAVVVTSNVAFAYDDDYRDNPAVLGRLQESRQTALDGRDVWVQRYASLGADAEQIRLEKERGTLLRVSRRAYVRNPENLGRFFSDTPIVINYSAGDGSAELAIYPGGPWRATQEEQQRLSKVFDEWTKDVARYLKATRKLYEYLERNPSRARVCLGAVFEDLLPKEARANLEMPRMPDEDELVNDVHDGLSSVLGQFLVPKNESVSADELSHLVYDPFPAAITVRVPGKILEAQGFTGGAGGLTIPGLGLWDALRSLEGHWVSPDPIVAYYEHGRTVKSAKKTFDLEGFLARRRSYADTPSEYEIKKAVEQFLTPASVYRVRWAAPKPVKNDERWDWDQLDKPDKGPGSR